MAASPDSATTALTPFRSAPPIVRAWLGALLAAGRDGIIGARQAIDRMNRLIDEAHLDHPDS
jgi:hypothetical protein